MKEIWKDIPGYEGLYQVSDTGIVRALAVKKIRGRYVQDCGERILKQKQEKRGYRQVALSRSGIKRYFGVHQLVALAFIPNPLNKPTVNHKDGLKANNNQSNLEWATNKEQINHADSTGLRNISGVNHKLSKLTEQDVIAIRQNSDKLSLMQLARRYRLYRSTINKIRARTTWKHI